MADELTVRDVIARWFLTEYGRDVFDDAAYPETDRLLAALAAAGFEIVVEGEQERKWGVQFPGGVVPLASEGAARDFAERNDLKHRTAVVVWRSVRRGSWTEEADRG